MGRWTTLALLLTAAGAACAGAEGAAGGAAGAGGDAGAGPVRAVYALAGGVLAFGAVPFPDDAYLDADGRVRVKDIPSAAPEYADRLADALGDLDGFGVRPVVYVRFEAGLDANSLPKDPSDSLDADASVFMIDADTSSPDAYARIPVDVRISTDPDELRIRPAFGRALVPGRRYAAVVTDRVRALGGRSVAAAKRFAAIRDQAALDSALERAARSRYNPVLETLASAGLARRHVVALSVFHVQSARADLEQARALLADRTLAFSGVNAIKAGPDLDALLGSPPSSAVGLDDGAPHDHVGFMLHAAVATPNLLSASPEVHGAFTRSGAGQLVIKGEQDVFVTLWLPRGSTMDSPLPVVIFLHDLGRERSDAAGVADSLASAGFAVIAADEPFHGLRSGAGDTLARFTGEKRSDGFGDLPGDFIGEQDTAGDLMPMHPYYYRDAVRQSALETMALLQLIRSGDLSGIRDAAPELSGLSLDPTRIGLLGMGLGAQIAAIAASFEPDLGAVVLAFNGSAGVDGWLSSPTREPHARTLASALGRELDRSDSADPPGWWPDLDAFRTLADRANPLAYAGGLRRSAINELLLMARDDEVADNPGSEALAYALGAVAIGGEPRHELALETDTLRPSETLSGNFTVEGGDVTRVLFVIDPATHDALVLEHGRQRFEHPPLPPFEALPKVLTTDNPTGTLLTQLGFLFSSLRACPTGKAVSACAASFQAPAAVR